MGFFSWKTSDTKKSISNTSSSRGPLPVYLITPDNEKIYEPHYQGFGVFGSFDAYALLAKWNVPEECNGNIEHDRLIGIVLEIERGPAKFPLKFAENPECSYDDLPPAQDDPAQGYFYNDEPENFSKSIQKETQKDNINEKDGRKLLGHLNLGKSIIIADPSYEPDSKPALKIDNLVPGKYNVFIDRKDCQDFGVRTARITIASVEYPYKEPKKLLNKIPVDSGTIGMYDKDYRMGEQQKKPKWYKFIDKCAIHNKLPNDKAAVCQTGLGDGIYPVFVKYDKMGQIYAVSIRFIKD